MKGSPAKGRTQRRTAPGARWLRCDLHSHTPFDPAKKFGEDVKGAIDALKKEEPRRLAEIAERYIEACRAAAGGEGLDIVALTDHNSVEGYELLKPQLDSLANQAESLGKQMPTVLPGVEFSVGGERPLHFLAVFSAETDPTEITKLILYVFGTREPFDKKSGTPRATGTDVGKFLERFHGYCRPDTGERDLRFVLLPAHIEAKGGAGRETRGAATAVESGILEEARGHLRQWVISRRDWNGFESNRPFEDLPQVLQELLCRWAAAKLGEDWGALSPAQRTRYQERRHWALVECSDPHSYEDVGTRYSWMKMEVPDVEGIRLALLDPESRLRRMSEGPPAQAYSRIESLRVRNTDFFEALTVEFSPCLTTIIGGRGSGKSTVIEYLRYALDRERPQHFAGPAGEQTRDAVSALLGTKSRRDHGQSEGTLLPDHELHVTLAVAGRAYRAVRTGAGIKILYDQDGAETEATELDLRALISPRVLSQRQISRIAADPAAQRTELDALIDESSLNQVRSAEEAAVDRLLELQSERTGVEKQLDSLPTQKTQLEKVRAQLAVLERPQTAEALRQVQAYEAEKEWLDTAVEAVERTATRLDDEAQSIDDDVGQLSEVPGQAEKGRWLSAIGSRLTDTFAGASKKLRRLATQIRALGSELEAGRAEEWEPRYEVAKKEYDKLSAELDRHGVEVSQHDKLLTRRASLDRQVKKLQALPKQLSRVEAEIKAQRADLAGIRERRAGLRRHQAKRLEDLDADIRLEIWAFRDRADFEGRRDQWFGGAGLQDRDWKVLADHIFAPNGSIPDRIADVVAALRAAIKVAQSGQAVGVTRSKLAAVLGSSKAAQLTGHFFRALERGDRFRLDDVERFLPEDLVEAKVRAAGQEFKPISTGSVGERSTAILSLMLSGGDQPLIIDQPEDDLDNRYVYDVVVDLLRRRKFSRQIIVATHNANIPVNGDAELIVSLGVENRCGICLAAGSIDRAEIKDLVTVIMEGSAEAFRLRRERYGF